MNFGNIAVFHSQIVDDEELVESRLSKRAIEGQRRLQRFKRDFNVFYYKFFHIWKDTFDVRSQVSFSSTKDDARMLSKDLKSQILYI